MSFNQSSSYGLGNSGGGGGGGGTVTGGNNGVSLVGANIQLGNAVGGTAADLLSDREIELSDFSLTFKHGADGLIFKLFGIDQNKIVISDSGISDDPYGTVMVYLRADNHERALYVEGDQGVLYPWGAHNENTTGILQADMYNDLGHTFYQALSASGNAQNPDLGFLYTSTNLGMAFFVQDTDNDLGGLFICSGNVVDQATFRLTTNGRLLAGVGAGGNISGLFDAQFSAGDFGANQCYMGFQGGANILRQTWVYNGSQSFYEKFDATGYTMSLNDSQQESSLNMSANQFVINEPGFAGNPTNDLAISWMRFNSGLQARKGLFNFFPGGIIGVEPVGNTVYTNQPTTPQATTWALSTCEIGAEITVAARSGTFGTDIILPGAETVRIGGFSGNNVSTSTQDACITLVKISTTEWVVTAQIGVWGV